VNICDSRSRIRYASLGEIGYELFDKPMLGMTDFVQKMNFHRALEGEIARTLTEWMRWKARDTLGTADTAVV